MAANTSTHSACPPVQLHDRHTATQLLEGLDREELRVYFQPIRSLSTDRTAGAESLLRWQHPVLGLLSPAYFENALLEAQNDFRLFEWVAKQTLLARQKWGEAASDMFSSVNISGTQLLDPSFLQQLHAWLENEPIEVRTHFKMELVESTLISDYRIVGTLVSLCEQWGVRVALDDFGTGHSSLQLLQEIPASIIKIDRCFVQQILKRTTSKAIVANIISLAKNLGKTTIAEGVELEEQYHALKALGCDFAQGYWIGRPMPNADFVAYLKSPI